MSKAHLRLVSPRAVIGTVAPRRKPNSELRTRELTEAEVERLMKAAKANRHGQCDATMILIAFRPWGARSWTLCIGFSALPQFNHPR